MRKSILALFSLLLAFAAQATPPQKFLWTAGAAGYGVIAQNVAIPNTRDGGTWPNLVDFYIPAGQTQLSAAVVLQGGSGSKEKACANWHVCLAVGVTNPSQVNWSLIDGWKVVFAFPQGQAVNGAQDNCNYASFTATISGTTLNVTAVDASQGPLAVGKTIQTAGVATGTTITALGSGTGGVGTYTVNTSQTVASQAMKAYGTAPISPSATTWCNWSMTSGTDDKEFLSELSDYISNTYGVGRAGAPGGKTLFGQSNGGMMAWRMICEKPGAYAHYVLVSGPLGSHWNSVPCTPASAVPMLFWYGRLDNVLDINGGPAGAGDHWTDAIWQQNAAQLAPADLAFPGQTTWIGGTYHVALAAQLLCSQTVGIDGTTGQILDYGALGSVATRTAVNVGTKTQWQFCNDQVELNLLSDGNHSIGTQEQANGVRLMNASLQWIKGLP